MKSRIYIFSSHSILMLVFDLSRFEDMNMREEEVRGLCHWLQTVFCSHRRGGYTETADSLVIVGGKRRDNCERSENVQEYLKVARGSCMDSLDDVVFRTLNMENIKILAIENLTAFDDPQESGLAEVEALLDGVARKIIVDSTEVPLH